MFLSSPLMCYAISQWCIIQYSMGVLPPSSCACVMLSTVAVSCDLDVTFTSGNPQIWTYKIVQNFSTYSQVFVVILLSSHSSSNDLIFAKLHFIVSRWMGSCISNRISEHKSAVADWKKLGWGFKFNNYLWLYYFFLFIATLLYELKDQYCSFWLTLRPVFLDHANEQECPKCHATIEKDGGCNHMVCKRCRFDFCWVCLGPWEPHGSSWYAPLRLRLTLDL